jgi:hypothetical protein
MKKLLSLFPATVLCVGGLVFAPVSVNAQTKPPAPAAAGKEELIKIKDVTVGVQKTPKFQTEGPKEKHWKPKDWLEIEVECEALPSKKNNDPKKATTYPEVTFKYFVYLEGQSADKTRILTGEVVHTNVPIKEVSHSVMYVTPSTIFAANGKPEANPTQVKYWGVLVTIGGETVGYKVKPGSPGTVDKPWWEDPKAPAKETSLKNKSETPFAILWADYHLDIKGK